MTETLSASLSEPNQIGRLTPWDLDFRQLSSGSGETNLHVRVGKSVTALSIEMQSDVHQIGQSPPGQLTVGLPIAGSLRTWLGDDAPNRSLIAFGSGHEFDGVSAAGFKAVTLSFSKEHMSALSDDFGVEISDGLLRPTVFELDGRLRPMQVLARKSKSFMAHGTSQADLEAEEEISLALLLTAASAKMRRANGPERLRDRALRRAIDLVEAQTEHPPTIRELCKISGASWPTLHRAFVERFGIGPKAYLSYLRLTRVRSELLAAQGDKRVVDIANSQGFWHMGQFASDYRKLFKRLPSEDLKSLN